MCGAIKSNPELQKRKKRERKEKKKENKVIMS